MLLVKKIFAVFALLVNENQHPCFEQGKISIKKIKVNYFFKILKKEHFPKHVDDKNMNQGDLKMWVSF